MVHPWGQQPHRNLPSFKNIDLYQMHQHVKLTFECS